MSKCGKCKTVNATLEANQLANPGSRVAILCGVGVWIAADADADARQEEEGEASKAAEQRGQDQRHRQVPK